MLYRGLVVLLSVVTYSVSAQTHFKVESQNLISNSELLPSITGYMTHGFTKSQLSTLVLCRRNLLELDHALS